MGDLARIRISTLSYKIIDNILLTISWFLVDAIRYFQSTYDNNFKKSGYILLHKNKPRR